MIQTQPIFHRLKLQAHNNRHSLLRRSIKVNDKYAAASIYGYMANTYADRNDFKEMLKVAEKSLMLSKELQSRQMLASSLYNMAYASYFNGDNIAARKHINAHSA